MTTPDPQYRDLWAGVFIRENRLRLALDGWGPRVARFLTAHDEEWAHVSDEGWHDRFRERVDAHDQLLYQGEVILMFADATTNTLAEALLRTWEIPRRDRAEGLRRVIGLVNSADARLDPPLPFTTEDLWSVYMGVNLPRHVLAVHPPGGKSANRMFLGQRIYMGWIETWDPKAELWVDLERRVRAETAIPDDVAQTPDRLLAWILDKSHGLSRESLGRLEDYAWANGVMVSPERAAQKVLDLVSPSAAVFGWTRKDFFSNS